MKIVFFSDLHGKVNLLEKLIEKENPDELYALGDLELCKSKLEKYKITSIKGNCDNENLPLYLRINLDGTNILLLHGHTHNVKIDLNNVYYFSLSNNCETVIFGHTHKILYQKEEGFTFLNPGSLRDNETYLVYENNIFKHHRL